METNCGRWSGGPSFALFPGVPDREPANTRGSSDVLRFGPRERPASQVPRLPLPELGFSTKAGMAEVGPGWAVPQGSNRIYWGRHGDTNGGVYRMAVWVVRGGEREDEEEALETGVLALGYGLREDLSNVMSWQDVQKLLRDKERGAKDASTGARARSIWRFKEKIEVGDLVVMPRRSQKTVAIAEMVGEYFFRPRATPPISWPSSRLDQQGHVQGCDVTGLAKVDERIRRGLFPALPRVRNCA